MTRGFIHANSDCILPDHAVPGIAGDFASRFRVQNLAERQFLEWCQFAAESLLSLFQ